MFICNDIIGFAIVCTDYTVPYTKYFTDISAENRASEAFKNLAFHCSDKFSAHLKPVEMYKITQLYQKPLKGCNICR